jgi:murein DD-endopeptidase MepM/ murein hydrolase activator NlpD
MPGSTGGSPNSMTIEGGWFGEPPHVTAIPVIEHDDGTAALYAHMQQNAAVVGVGDEVAAAETIATSGNSGFADENPHLHSELYSQFPYHWLDDSIPVTFRNAGGQLDERGGLQYGETYTALQ